MSRIFPFDLTMSRLPESSPGQITVATQCIFTNTLDDAIVRYCKKCVQPDTRPHIVFDEEGVCLPCRAFEAQSKQEVNWASRRKELDEIVAWGRANSESGYDCIIGVSGGKDSTRQALLARDDLGLKPLLVSCTYPPEQQTERGAYNLANLISLGFDTITVSPDPQIWKYMMKKGIDRFGNWCKSTEMALKASLPRMAISFRIPLILIGENPALTSGDWAGSFGGDGNKWQYSHTLAGGPLTLLDREGELTDQEILWYFYPSDEEMNRAKLRVVFLGYYFQDFNWFTNAAVSVAHGLRVREDPPEDTGNVKPYDALDDDFVIVNQMLKYLKFGFGKVTDHVCEGIRTGEIKYEEAVDLVRRYDGRCAPRFIRRFCDYLQISEEEFWRIADGYRNLDHFEKNADGQWRLKDPIWSRPAPNQGSSAAETSS